MLLKHGLLLFGIATAAFGVAGPNRRVEPNPSPQVPSNVPTGTCDTANSCTTISSNDKDITKSLSNLMPFTDIEDASGPSIAGADSLHCHKSGTIERHDISRDLARVFCRGVNGVEMRNRAVLQVDLDAGPGFGKFYMRFRFAREDYRDFRINYDHCVQAMDKIVRNCNRPEIGYTQGGVGKVTVLGTQYYASLDPQNVKSGK